ncbi:MAG: glutaredoxin family protein [Hylemonella sp.]|nr:glutaredoxin family protein [Hylemonella sp.]
MLPQPLPRPCVRLLTFTALLVALGVAHSQSVYRIVGPDGKVTFSDRPPAAGKDTPAGTRVTSGGATNPSLPYELKLTVAKFPVTLYTSANCNPCANAKALLNQRGVPYTEKSIASNEDLAALQKLSGDTQLPFGTIGSQQIKGFSSLEWAQYLDAAGYPSQSQLPQGYRNPEPSPLVAMAKPAAPVASAPEANRAPTSRAPSAPRLPANDPKSNPAGIRF